MDTAGGGARDRIALAYLGVAGVAAVFAFVGFGASNYWTDELFTLHVIGHGGGLAEVWRRALTDTHPPLYYMLMYPWVQALGQQEWVLRLPSAAAAVAALAMFFLALRRRFEAPAVAFATAVAALSTFWFEQSQNGRSYALALALSAAMLWAALAFRERMARRERGAWGALAWLLGLGMAGSLTHSYLLLSTGMVLLYLLLAVPDRRARVLLVAGGLAILAVNLAYVAILLRSTQQDVHNLWFDNGARFFWGQVRIAWHDLLPAGGVYAVLVLLLAIGHRRWGRGAAAARLPAPAQEAAWMSLFVLAGVVASGIAVSYLIAPSFSARNVSTASPYAWLLLAALYQKAGPDPRTRGGRWLALAVLVLVAAQLALLRGRLLQRNEAWRDSAHFIAALPACAGQDLAVVLPYKFGPSTPPFRRLAEQAFFGRYLGNGMRLHAWLPAEIGDRRHVPELQRQLAERARQAAAGGCPVLAWGVHDLEGWTALELAQDLARLPGVSPNRIVVQEFQRYRRRSLGWRRIGDGWVFLLAPPLPAGTPLRDPGAALALPAAAALGERRVVSHLYRFDGRDGPAYTLDGFSIQRWPVGGAAPREDFVVARRMACDPPPGAGRNDLWPDPAAPGCSQRPAP